jgi:hypothetical protein
MKDWNDVEKSNKRIAHEATELAKLAVDLCELSGHPGVKPQDFLKDALDLILAAGELIQREEQKKFGIPARKNAVSSGAEASHQTETGVEAKAEAPSAPSPKGDRTKGTRR